ncbi:MAG: SpoIIE family protein phosphatase [Bacillota bacterium]|nr:SpoIIE family protein phosphatase [Bacillota bacterium]
MKILAAAETNVGRLRGNNEDNFYINGVYKEDTQQTICGHASECTEGVQVFSVCDGIGGVDAGEVASLLAVEELARAQKENPDTDVRDYVARANDRVCRKVSESGGLRMGSTIVLMTINGSEATICNVGDSRGYLLREGELMKLTVDHVRKRGLEGPARSHVLTQFLGVFPEEFILEPHVERMEIRSGDVFLLCSDGLTDMAGDEEIHESIMANAANPPEIIAKQLVKAAIKNGGRDNVTVLIVKVI